MLTPQVSSSRTAHFAQGTQPTETPSLQARAQAFKQQVPGKFQANGLNQPIMLSPVNGNSPEDAARQTPNGELPSMNGSSRATYQQRNPTSYGTALKI